MMNRRLLFVSLAALFCLLVGAAVVTAQDSTDFHDLLTTLPSERQADGGFVLGEASAPITIVEFADYACPHCQVYRSVMDEVIQQYVATGQARFEFRVFPTAGGRRTTYAATVAECAGVLHPGGFWLASEDLYALAMAGRYNDTLGRLVADDLGIDYLSMLGCMWRARQIYADYQLGVNLGVNGTPAVVVRYGDADPVFIEYDGTKYDQGGPAFEVLSAVIEAANQQS